MQRICYLDNLKVCLTVLVIMHHAGQAYGNGGGWPYTPSNPEEFMPWIWHFFSTNASFFMGLYFYLRLFCTQKFRQAGSKAVCTEKTAPIRRSIAFHWCPHQRPYSIRESSTR